MEKVILRKVEWKLAYYNGKKIILRIREPGSNLIYTIYQLQIWACAPTFGVAFWDSTALEVGQMEVGGGAVVNAFREKIRVILGMESKQNTSKKHKKASKIK